MSVGDVVLLKNPLESDKLIVRRLAALGGQEMASTDKKDEPFVIDFDECWVLSDNKRLKAMVFFHLLSQNFTAFCITLCCPASFDLLLGSLVRSFFVNIVTIFDC